MRNLYFKAVSVLLFFAVIMSVFATGCEFPFKDGTPDTDKAQNTGKTQPTSLESGFYASEGCEISQFHCDYKSDKTEFDIDNVTLDFYYGVHFLYTEEDEREIVDIPSFDLYFTDWKGTKRIFIRHVEENLVSEKYRCHIDWKENSKITYNHCETHTIPREMFTGESDFIYFAVFGTDVREYEPEYRCRMSATMCYKVIDERVVLSPIPFDVKLN